MIIFVFLLGRIRVTKYGPRIFWERHYLSSMGLGYGGCFVPEYIPETNVSRVFSRFCQMIRIVS